jgi:hypothetical protein
MVIALVRFFLIIRPEVLSRTKDIIVIRRHALQSVVSSSVSTTTVCRTYTTLPVLVLVLEQYY